VLIVDRQRLARYFAYKGSWRSRVSLTVNRVETRRTRDARRLPFLYQPHYAHRCSNDVEGLAPVHLLNSSRHGGLYLERCWRNPKKPADS